MRRLDLRILEFGALTSETLCERVSFFFFGKRVRLLDMLRNTAVWSVNGCFFFFGLFFGIPKGAGLSWDFWGFGLRGFFFLICVGDLTGDLAELEFQAIVVERGFFFGGVICLSLG